MKRFRILVDDFQNPLSPSDMFCKGLIYNSDKNCHPDLPELAERLVFEGKAEWDDVPRRIAGTGMVQ